MKSRKNLKAELRDLLETPVVLRKGSSRQRVALLSAIVADQADRALQGDAHATKVIVEIARECGVFDGSHQEIGYDLNKLSADELDALESILEKTQMTIREGEGED
ncbi:hypothetical protein [Bradyrhizobium sp. CSS354]|uniref:hypothetical protein n=1 Tax=Bradyrhizobium sp. CSS354 TaxID=2699172 RepID=UPI0023AFD906|nr:hypothetical protein [Bradyrhizobium sp. CSS354]MDE5463350.1 hypothetical protein [Bradyrhizobium sp. CSS354]